MPRTCYRFFAVVLCFLFVFQQSGFAQVAGTLNVAGYAGSLRNILVPDKFRPLHLRYLAYDPLNNDFRVFLDRGDARTDAARLPAATGELFTYFLVGVTLPNSSFWVNLRPDSENEMIDTYLAQTDVGKILLEADLQLKKDAAGLTSPETPEGKEYWNKLYQKAEELFGSEEITIPALVRPWIVPGEIIIRESPANAYIYKATLKVMLEEDYLKNSQTYRFDDERLRMLNQYSSQLVRELIIPRLTKMVNVSKKYAALRQVYYSLILAQWFKAKFAGTQGQYAQLIDAKKLADLTSQAPWSKTAYFKQYQKSFKNGEYNLSVPVYGLTGQSIRQYFSGGISFAAASSGLTIAANAERQPVLTATVTPAVVAGEPGNLAVSFAVPAVVAPTISAPAVASSALIDEAGAEGWDDDIAQLYATQGYQQLRAVAVGDPSSVRAQQAAGALERTLFREGLSGPDYVAAARGIGALVPARTALIRGTTIDSLLRVFTYSGLDRLTYLEAGYALGRIALALPQLFQAPQIAEMERLLGEEGADEAVQGVYQVVLQALGDLAAARPELMRSTTVPSIENLLGRFGLTYYQVHIAAARALERIAAARPDLVREETVSLLERFLGRQELHRDAYSVALKAIVRIVLMRPDLARPATVATLEAALTRPRLDAAEYQDAADALKKIGETKAELIADGSLARVAVGLSGETIRSGLAHYRVYSNPSFVARTAGMIAQAGYKVARSVYRLLLRQGKEATNEADTNRAVDAVLAKRSAVGPRAVFAPRVPVVNLAHQHERFSIEKIEALERQAMGLTPEEDTDLIGNYKGAAQMSAGLDAIRAIRGALTVLFSGHAEDEHLWFDGGEPGRAVPGGAHLPIGISYQELGKALLERGDLASVTLLLDACLSHNFALNLLAYLKLRGAQEFPVIITASNLDRVSYDGQFLDMLTTAYRSHGGLLTVQDVFDSENTQGATVFVPLTASESLDLFGPDYAMLISAAALQGPLEMRLPLEVIEASSALTEMNRGAPSPARDGLSAATSRQSQQGAPLLTPRVIAGEAVTPDGRTIPVSFDADGVIDGIERLGRDSGLRVQFAGGVARKMVFGAYPLDEASDIDIMVSFIDDAARVRGRAAIEGFRQQMKANYPQLNITIMNWANGELAPPYQRYGFGRVATVDRLLVGREGGVWQITDERGGEYLDDAREHRIRLIPSSTSDGRGIPLDYNSVLRFVRLMAEFPDATIDAGSLREISEFVGSGIYSTERPGYSIEQALGDFAQRGEFIGPGVFYLSSLLKVFRHAQRPEAAADLVKSIGTPEKNLYTIFSGTVDFGALVSVAQQHKAGATPWRWSDFDAAFPALTEKNKFAKRYTLQEFSDLLIDEAGLRSQEERDAAASFIQTELGGWLEKTNDAYVGSRIVFMRGFVENLWKGILLSGLLQNGWAQKVEGVVSGDFASHLRAHAMEIAPQIYFGKYRNLIDYYTQNRDSIRAAPLAPDAASSSLKGGPPEARRSRISDEERDAWEEERLSHGAGFSNIEVKERVRSWLGQLNREGKVGRVILDVASGEDLPLTRDLSESGHTVLGIDISIPTEEHRFSETALIVKGDVQNIAASLARPSVRDFIGSSAEPFDTALLSDILNYVNFRQVIRDVVGVLKPGGRVIIANKAGAGLTEWFSLDGVTDDAGLVDFLENEPGIDVEFHQAPNPRDAVARQFIIIRKAASSALTDNLPEGPRGAARAPGGVDFRSLPIRSVPVALETLFRPGQAVIPAAELEQAWRQMQELLAKGEAPPSEKLRTYIASCPRTEEFSREVDKVLVCVAEIMRLEEDEVTSTAPELKELLAALESLPR